MDHPLGPDITESKLDTLVSDGDDRLIFGFDNGVVIELRAVLAGGFPRLHVTRVSCNHKPRDFH